MKEGLGPKPINGGCAQSHLEGLAVTSLRGWCWEKFCWKRRAVMGRKGPGQGSKSRKRHTKEIQRFAVEQKRTEHCKPTIIKNLKKKKNSRKNFFYLTFIFNFQKKKYNLGIIIKTNVLHSNFSFFFFFNDFYFFH